MVPLAQVDFLGYVVKEASLVFQGLELLGQLVTKEKKAFQETQVYQAVQGQRVKQDKSFLCLVPQGQMVSQGHLAFLESKVTGVILGFQENLDFQEKKVLLGSQE